MKVYAYVAAECCVHTRAQEPGTEYQGVRISQHPDYWVWTAGKRETLRLIAAGSSHQAYTRRAARAVAELLGWL